MKINKFKYTLCCLSLLILFSACGGNEYIGEYENLQHRGSKEVVIDKISIDTIYIDASETSLMGKWGLNNGKLYFLDYNLVGIKEFDLDGNFIDFHIRQGNAPNEWMSPFVDFCFDKNHNLIVIDRNWIINRFDSLFVKCSAPYIYLSDINYGEQQWNKLLKKPSKEDFHMYIFNLNSRKMLIVDEKLLIPVVSEHIKYNGYDINKSKEFWKESYNFMLIDVKERKTEAVFGTYPPIFSKSNIPIFSNYSFDKLNHNGDIIISYAVDSLIYVRDKKGVLKYSFGYDSEIIDSEYTQTKSFDEYSERYKKELQQKSYYTYIKTVGDYVIRGYKRDKDKGYGFQIYKNKNLIGEIDSREEITVFGAYNEYIYATLPTDLESDNFKIAKISINR